MSCRKATTAAPTENKVHTRDVRPNSVGGHSICPRPTRTIKLFLQCSHKPKAPLCKGSWRVSA